MAGKYKILSFIFIFALVTCGKLPKKSEEHPLAKVYDSYLYPSDLKGDIPTGISSEDSIHIARRLIEEWARERLLLKRAEQYLSYDQKNVDKQIEEYRLSLLTFKYKQILLAQNLDTIIKNEELQKYYEEYSSNYILDADVVKVTFVKVPLTAPQLNEVRQWYRSNNIEDLDKLEKYCLNYAERYIIKGEKWFKFTELIEGLPLKIDNPGRYLDYTTNIDVKDSVYNFFIHIYERIPESQVSPIDLVRNNIRSVILNKRKIEFIQDLENSIYKDGLSRNQVEIY
jgi:hypothetical protein